MTALGEGTPQSNGAFILLSLEPSVPWQSGCPPGRYPCRACAHSGAIVQLVAQVIVQGGHLFSVAFSGQAGQRRLDICQGLL